MAAFTSGLYSSSPDLSLHVSLSALSYLGTLSLLLLSPSCWTLLQWSNTGLILSAGSRSTTLFATSLSKPSSSLQSPFHVPLVRGTLSPLFNPVLHLTKLFQLHLQDWKPNLGLRHVLLVIRCLLIEPFPESALNEEAGKMLMEDYEGYARHAQLMTSIHALKPKGGATKTAAEGGKAGPAEAQAGTPLSVDSANTDASVPAEGVPHGALSCFFFHISDVSFSVVYSVLV